MTNKDKLKTASKLLSEVLKGFDCGSPTVNKNTRKRLLEARKLVNASKDFVDKD